MACAVDNASLTVLKDLRVSGEVKENMEAFGLGMGNRDIYDNWNCHRLSVRFAMREMESDRLPSGPILSYAHQVDTITI